MEIKEFNEFESIEGLKEQWDTLVKSEKSGQWLFHTYGWYKNWWEAFGKKIKPIIILVFEEQELIGIAPCGLSNIIKFGIPIKQISLLANEHSPKNTIIAKGSGRSIVKVIIQTLLTHYPDSLIYFEDMAKDDPVYQNIINYAVSNKIDAKERVARTTSIIEINNDWTGYIQKKTKKFRTYTRKIERDFQKSNHKIEHYKHFAEIDGFFAKGQAIAVHSWQGNRKSSLFSQGQLKRFYYGFAQLAAAEGVLDILCLVKQNKPIAYLFNICINNTLYLIKQEYDSRYSHLAPGFYLDLVAIKEAFAEQLKCIDMLGFATKYKERWATDIFEDKRIFIYQGLSAKAIKYIDFNIRNAVKMLIGR